MATPEESRPAAVEALRMQLQALAEPSGLPVPALRVDLPRREERLPTVRGIDGEPTVVVPPSLLDAPAARQQWELAACLGRLASSVPAQRRRLGGTVLLVVLVALLVLIVARPVSWAWITPLALYPIGAFLLRWERRAMDDAAREVLAAAGHRPVDVARQAFRDQPDPPWMRALLTAEPTPGSRLRAALAAERPAGPEG